MKGGCRWLGSDGVVGRTTRRLVLDGVVGRVRRRLGLDGVVGRIRRRFGLDGVVFRTVNYLINVEPTSAIYYYQQLSNKKCDSDSDT